MGYYDEIAGGYDELHSEEQLAKLRLIAEHLDVRKEAMLLDVGCGTGLSARIFGCQITGIDPSEELLKQCPFPAKKACAEKIPFPDNYFDIVIAVTCIHNFNDIEKGLREIRRVGKNRFALTVLKKSSKKGFIVNKIQSLFLILECLEQQRDLILLCA